MDGVRDVQRDLCDRQFSAEIAGEQQGKVEQGSSISLNPPRGVKRSASSDSIFIVVIS